MTILANGSYHPDAGTTASLLTELAAMASAENTQFGKREIFTYRWADASARGSQAGMRAGDWGLQIDTGVTYRYSGSAWRPDADGVAAIVPTAEVTGTSPSVTVGAGGKVTFTDADSISLNGVFTSEYDAYRVIIRELATASAGRAFRMRASGTDITTSTYDYNYVDVENGASSAGDLTGNDRIPMAASTATTGFGEFTVLSPAEATPTLILGRYAQWASGGNQRIRKFQAAHQTASAFDGFTIFPNTSGTFTGWVQVQGMNSF